MQIHLRNKEIKGCPSPCTTQVCAVGFSGCVAGYPCKGQVSVGWFANSFHEYITTWTCLELFVEKAVAHAESLGYKAGYGYDQHDTLWIFVEIKPKSGSFVMTFGSEDFKLEQKATSWYGKLDKDYVLVENYGYLVVLE